MHQTTAAAAAAASAVGPVHNSVPSNPVAAPGFFIHPSDVIPPTPKTTPLFMTPPLTPPNEAVSAVINAELAQLFPGSVIDPPTVNLAAHNKNTSKSRTVIIFVCFSYRNKMLSALSGSNLYLSASKYLLICTRCENYITKFKLFEKEGI